MQFEKVSVSATLAAVDEGLSGVLAVFYDGDPERGGEAFDAGLIPHIRANDRYVARVRFQPRTCGAHTAYVVAQAAVASSSTVDVECPPPPFAEVSGKAEQLGVPGATAKVKIRGKISSANTLDLRFATLTMSALLLEQGGGELVRAGGGSPLCAPGAPAASRRQADGRGVRDGVRRAGERAGGDQAARPEERRAGILADRRSGQHSARAGKSLRPEQRVERSRRMAALAQGWREHYRKRAAEAQRAGWDRIKETLLAIDPKDRPVVRPFIDISRDAVEKMPPDVFALVCGHLVPDPSLDGG